MYSRFSVAVVLSLLLHLLLLLALYQQDVAAPVLQTAKAAPLTVQIISPPQQRPKPETTAAKAPQKSATSTRQAQEKIKPKQTPTMVKTAKPQPKNAAPSKAATFATASSASTQPAAGSTTEPAAKQTTTASIAPGIANRILNRVAAQQQQQAGQLSSEEVQALWQKPTESKAIDVSRYGPKPADAADNVLEVMADGSFIEKVGDYCYQAKDGADLRRDIASMKPVPCGEDANDALYNSIMNKIGK